MVDGSIDVPELEVSREAARGEALNPSVAREDPIMSASRTRGPGDQSFGKTWFVGVVVGIASTACASSATAAMSRWPAGMSR